MAVPHDILEHTPNEKYGAVEGEFMALGAAYFLRVETGWFSERRGNQNGIDNLASDIPMIIQRVIRDE